MTDTDTDAPVMLKREILIDKPGFYRNITSKQYFAEPCPAPALTNSGIKTLLAKTPADFAYEHPAITPDSPEAASTAAKRLGDVCHQLALGKGRGIAIGEFDAWRSKEAKEFKADAEANGLTPIIREKYDDAMAMASIMKAKIAATLKWIGAKDGLVEPDGGWPYETEVVIAWTEETASGPIFCRAMIDVWCEDLLVALDPKFSDRFYVGIERHMTNMSWDQQAAFYTRGIEALLPGAAGRVTFANIMVSDKEPHRSRRVMIEEAWRYSCQLEIEKAIGLFAMYLKAGTWPEFPDGVETLNAPPWLLAQRLNANEMSNDQPFGDDEDEENTDA